MTTTQPSRPSSKRQRKPSQGEKQRRPAKTEYYHLRTKRRLKRHGEQIDRLNKQSGAAHQSTIHALLRVAYQEREIALLQLQLGKMKKPSGFFKVFVTLALLYLFLEPFLFRLI